MDVARAEPATEAALLERARQLAGLTLASLAQGNGNAVPADLRMAKGWIGQQLEKHLGATSGSQPEPDFPHLGIELKTLPVDHRGQPKESTYVCTVPMHTNLEHCWEVSWVRRKLQRVLWIPIQADKALAIGERRIGNPLLWSPSAEQAQVLKQDWEELTELIGFGRFDQVSARQGQYLQIRPKAANSRALCQTHDEQGLITQTLPRGFYLRTRLTARILKDHYATAG